MEAKLAVEVGQVFEARFAPNPVAGSRYPWRARHLSGRRAPKVVLCKDPRVRPGQPCQVRIREIQKRSRADHGSIVVEYLRAVGFELEGVWVDPGLARKLRVALDLGLNVLLDGPQGCGKTVLVKAMAAALGYTYVFFGCSAVADATDFLATLVVQASGTGQPVTEFLKTPFLEALEEAHAHPDRRFLVFLDELNRAEAKPRNSLMPALDGTRRIFNPVTSSFLAIPDNVQFVAAINRGTQYTSTYDIDVAQLDRFCPLVMDYPPLAEEVQLLAARHPALGRDLIRTIVTIANRLRLSEEVTSGLSVRATIEACDFLEHPLYADNPRQELPEILKSVFCGRIGGGRWNELGSEAGAAWAIIESALGTPPSAGPAPEE